MMEQRLELRLRQTQRLIMTPRMQQSIRFLQLPTLELTNEIQKELQENPILEEAPPLEVSGEESSSAEQEGDSQTVAEASPAEATPDEDTRNDEFDERWLEYFEDSSDVGYIPPSVSEQSETFEPTLVHQTTFEEHLIWQINVSPNLKNQADQDIAETIIRNLDHDGFLALPLEALAEQTGSALEEVERVLKVTQGFDPVGIGARDLGECLEIQYHYYEMHSPLALEIIRHHIEDLEHHRLSKIAKALDVSEQLVQEMADLIGTLEPKPGRVYQQQENEYITPDVFVEKVDGEWQVRVNDEGTPPLKISKRYRQMLLNPDGVDRKDLEFIRERFKSAIYFIRNIEQRRQTLYKVTRSVFDLQRDFLERGLEGLRPMKLRDVADIVGVHEATVCRVVNNKYVQTPQGLFELKYFFSTGLGTDDGRDASVKTVMSQISRMIDQEDIYKPLSDEKITKMLNRGGINIARRTVAKYREKMGILPTNTRKRV